MVGSVVVLSRSMMFWVLVLLLCMCSSRVIRVILLLSMLRVWLGVVMCRLWCC